MPDTLLSPSSGGARRPRLTRALPGVLLCLPSCALLAILSGCAVPTPLVMIDPLGPTRPDLADAVAQGELVVFSGARASIVEQSEYPIHTAYTLMDSRGRPLRRIENSTGTFGGNPVVVPLPAGTYRVKAQDEDGRYVIVPVVIEAKQRTIVQLDGTPPPPNSAASADFVRLPDGQVVGWRARTPYQM